MDDPQGEYLKNSEICYIYIYLFAFILKQIACKYLIIMSVTLFTSQFVKE